MEIHFPTDRVMKLTQGRGLIEARKFSAYPAFR